jgi:hypothetical protein
VARRRGRETRLCACDARSAQQAGPSTSPLDATLGRSAKREPTVNLDAAADALLLTAGGAMLVHFALCAIARRGLGRNPAIERELFTVPNRWLGAPDLIRLLRVRYFLPFRALPEGSHVLESWVRTTLLAARVSGLIFVCAIICFFIAVFIEAGS